MGFPGDYSSPTLGSVRYMVFALPVHWQWCNTIRGLWSAWTLMLTTKCYPLGQSWRQLAHSSDRCGWPRLLLSLDPLSHNSKSRALVKNAIFWSIPTPLAHLKIIDFFSHISLPFIFIFHWYCRRFFIARCSERTHLTQNIFTGRCSFFRFIFNGPKPFRGL